MFRSTRISPTICSNALSGCFHKRFPPAAIFDNRPIGLDQFLSNTEPGSFGFLCHHHPPVLVGNIPVGGQRKPGDKIPQDWHAYEMLLETQVQQGVLLVDRDERAYNPHIRLDVILPQVGKEKLRLVRSRGVRSL